MPTHKLIRGGEEYLPLALRQLERLAEVAKDQYGFANRILVIDNVTIKLSVMGPERFINISAPHVRYEFWTAGNIFSLALSSIESPGYTTGSMTRYYGGGKVRPMYTNRLAATPKLWNNFAATYGMWQKTRGYFPAKDVARYPVTHGAWQNQKFFEYVTWPGNSGDAMVTSVQALLPGINSQAHWCSDGGWLPPNDPWLSTSDTDFDVRSTYYDAVTSYSGTPDLSTQGAYAWWRRAAVQTVGDRKFFISTDNMGRFYVYPVKDYVMQTGDALVPPAGYKQYTPPYPTWVTMPDPNARKSVAHCWLWAFNKDATKAVSCPFHSVAGTTFKLILAGNRVDQTDRTEAACIAELGTPGTIYVDYMQARNDQPGLVEFNIAISLTGSGDMDFDATFTLGRVNYSGDSGGRYIFDAAYTLPDKSIAAKRGGGVADDTLVTAEVEMRYTDTTFFSFSGYGSTKFFVRANDASMTPTDLASFRMMDWKIDGSGTWFAAVRPYTYFKALELRNLSWVTQNADPVTGTVVDLAFVYNEEVYRKTTRLLGGATAGSYTEPTNLVPPSSFAKLHFQYVYLTMRLRPAQGFNIHPQGHWSYGEQISPWSAVTFDVPSAGTIGPLDTSTFRDVVQVYGDKPKTHRELYNKAFNQNQDYSFYAKYYNQTTATWQTFAEWDAWSFATYGTHLGLSARQYFDLGSFRTNGVWITF